jgi:hypothetical protein
LQVFLCRYKLTGIIKPVRKYQWGAGSEKGLLKVERPNSSGIQLLQTVNNLTVAMTTKSSNKKTKKHTWLEDVHTAE